MLFCQVQVVVIVTVASDETIVGYKIICPLVTVVPAYDVLNGYTVTWASGQTARVYGAIS